MQTQLTCKIPSLGAAGDLQVLDFAGEEALSRLFSFDVIAASTSEPLQMDQIIRQKVELSLMVSTPESGHQQRNFYGIITSVTDWGEGTGDQFYYFYKLTVRPLQWLLTLHKRSYAFQGLTIPKVVEAVLQNNKFAASDYKFDLRGDYQPCAYVVQHEETDWDFISRLLEHEGIFFYFINQGDKEVIVFQDYNPEAGGPLDLGQVRLIPYVHLHTDQVHLNQFTGRWRMSTGNVELRDDDYESFAGLKKELEVGEFSAEQRHGAQVEHIDTVQTREKTAGWSGDAADIQNELKEKRDKRLDQLLRRRQEEILANHGKFYIGSSNQALFAHSGVFELTGDVRGTARYAQKYLITSVRHAGSAASEFSGLTFSNRPQEEAYSKAYDPLFQLINPEANPSQGGYANSITCIELATNYRPPRLTPRPTIPGVVSGRIVGGIDEEGRYLIEMRSNREINPEGGPSYPVRQAQWFSLQDGGVHFPSELGTETALAFIDGDPSRPIIVGMVPNMEKHTPVPNTSLKLGSENPDEEAWKDTPISYDPLKSVIRTSAKHQIVMDDDSGKANVGITLQVGETPPPQDGQQQNGQQEPDVYWGSKSEYGGHRKKSKLERDVDQKTQGIDGLGSDAKKPGALQSLVQNGIEEKSYWEDASSDITPVGVQHFTNNRVELVGKNGIDLYTPHLTDPDSGQAPDPLDLDQNRGRVLGLSKFLTSALWRSVFKRLKDHISNALDGKPSRYGGGPVDAQPILEEPSQYDLARAKKRQEARSFEALRLPGVRVNAAGPVTMASFTSVDAVTGKGGFNVESFGDIVQHADRDAVLEAGHLVKIRTTGKKLSASALDDASSLASSLSGDASSLASAALGKADSTYEKLFKADDAESFEYFPILLQNEAGGIILHTEGRGSGMSPGHIDLYSEFEGDVRARSAAGKIAAHSTKEISLRVEASGQEKLDAFYDGELFGETTDGTRVALDTKDLVNFAKENVTIATTSESAGPYIKIERDQSITLKCGQSTITLKNDGTINIEGMTINIKAQQAISMEAQQSISQKANLEIKQKAMNVTSEADLQQTVKGALTNVEASGVLTQKGGVVMIN